MAVLCFEGYNDKIIKYIKKYKIDDSSFKRYLKEGSKVIGIDLSIFLADEEPDTGKVEIIIAKIILVYITGVCLCDKYMKSGIQVDLFVGYSLGFITAAVCSESITFSEGLSVFKCISECIRYADQVMDCSLLIEMGLDKKTVLDIIQKRRIEDKIKIVCVCSEYCLLLSGDNEAIDICSLDIKAEGALGVNKLDIRMPYHNVEYTKWIDRFCEPIIDLNVKDPKICCYSITMKKKLYRAEEILDGLKYDFVRELYWKESIELLEKTGNREFWDISLNGSLKKMTVFSLQDSEMYDYKYFGKKIADYHV